MYGIHFYFSMDGTLDGEILRYGQSFYISTMPEEGGNVSTINSLDGEILRYGQSFYISTMPEEGEM